MGDGLRIRVETGMEGVQRLRQDWLCVYSTLTCPMLCHDWRWVATLADTLFDDDMLLCCVYAESTPVAIFYFWRRHKKIGPFYYCALEGLTNSEFIVLSDSLVSPNYLNAPLLRFVLKELRDNKETSWDVFSVNNCSERSFLCQLDGIAANVEKTNNANAYFVCHTPEALSALSQKQKKNVSRCYRRAERELGALDIVVSTAESLQRDFTLFAELENKGWKGEAGERTSILASGEHAVAFYKRLIENFSLHEDVLIYTLYIGSVIGASAFCLRTGSILYVYKITYNEKLSQYSPGGILLLHIFTEMARADTIDEVNLLTCPEWSKRWHLQSASIKQIRFYSNSYRATLFRLLRLCRNIGIGCVAGISTLYKRATK